MVVLHQGLLTGTPFNAIKEVFSDHARLKNILIFYIKSLSDVYYILIKHIHLDKP